MRWRDVGKPGGGLYWSDAEAIIIGAPKDGPLGRALEPKWWWFNPQTDILAGILDRLSALIAFTGNQTKIPQSKVPKPMPRPGDVQERSRTIGGKVTMSLDKLDAWMNSRRE